MGIMINALSIASGSIFGSIFNLAYFGAFRRGRHTCKKSSFWRFRSNYPNIFFGSIFNLRNRQFLGNENDNL